MVMTFEQTPTMQSLQMQPHQKVEEDALSYKIMSAPIVVVDAINYQGIVSFLFDYECRY